MSSGREWQVAVRICEDRVDPTVPLILMVETKLLKRENLPQNRYCQDPRLLLVSQLKPRNEEPSLIQISTSLWNLRSFFRVTSPLQNFHFPPDCTDHVIGANRWVNIHYVTPIFRHISQSENPAGRHWRTPWPRESEFIFPSFSRFFFNIKMRRSFRSCDFH